MEIRSIGRRLFADIANDISKLEAKLANPGAEFEKAHKLIEADFEEKRVRLLELKKCIERGARITNEYEVVEFLQNLSRDYTGEVRDIRTIYATFEEILEDLGPGEIIIA